MTDSEPPRTRGGGEGRLSSVDSVVAELVDANHVLFDRGILDAYGHVSIRVPDHSEQFMLARNMAPALVTDADIQRFDLESATDDARPSYLERFIHSEIYKARPNVMAVVHSHSMSVIPFSVVDRPLRPVTHMSGFLGEAVPVFEIRETSGAGSDLLIRSSALGRSLAAALGEGNVVLMRGHGVVTVGSSLPQAAYRAVYTELNARVQADAMRLGSCTYLTAEESRSAMESVESQVVRAWELWRAEARAKTRFS